MERDAELSDDAFAALLAGRSPASGQPLRSSTTPHAVTGFDLAFKAPKERGSCVRNSALQGLSGKPTGGLEPPTPSLRDTPRRFSALLRFSLVDANSLQNEEFCRSVIVRRRLRDAIDGPLRGPGVAPAGGDRSDQGQYLR
jgi:hypothetical protein